MTKTRGLWRALGRQGREAREAVVDEEVPVSRRQRPTTSARRKRAEQVYIDVGPSCTPDEQPEESHQVEEPVCTDRTEADIGFPGGLHDTSLLRSYGSHIAIKVWEGQYRVELKLSSHGRKVANLGKPHAQIHDIVAQTGLAALLDCCQETEDRGLISAFVERWHRDTSTFHLPVGEMTITLDDVSALLHLPVMGAFHTFDHVDVQTAMLMLVDLLGVTMDEAIEECRQNHGAYVRLSWLRDVYHSRCEDMLWSEAARAFLLHLVGCTIFANKSSTHISVALLQSFRDLHLAGGYAWGAAALVHMYDNLNEASQHKTKHIAGFISLLQCWIYEHCPSIANMTVADDYHESQARAAKWKSGKALKVQVYRRRLDKVCADAVQWSPYDGHRGERPFDHISLFSGCLRWGPCIVSYLPERVLRQFRYVQTIPPPPKDYTAAPLTTEDIDDRWLHFSDYLAHTGDYAMFPHQCVDGYMEWFYVVSHPYMIPPEEGGAPRQPPHMPSPVPVIPHPGFIGPDIPQHASGVCDMISDILQHVLDLHTIPTTSEEYNIIQQCITLARSVTTHGNVYVRQRRRK